jgi:hypothetical protein
MYAGITPALHAYYTLHSTGCLPLEITQAHKAWPVLVALLPSCKAW